MDLMNKINNKNILLDDFNKVLDQDIKFNNFKDKVFLITGGTGLIGSLLVKFLLYCNKVMGLNISVIALVRSKEKANKVLSDYIMDSSLILYEYELAKGQKLDCPRADYVIHTAAVTKSSLMVEKPVEMILTAVNGTEEVFKFAVDKKAESVVYISSMEVYGQMDTTEFVTETDLGYVDIKNVRSGYPESKRMCECLCSAYAAEYGLNVKVARLAQTFGAGILAGENRVFAQFARSVINGNDIVLHTTGESEGNYVYTADAIAAILILLQKGKAGEAYNVSNEESYTTIRNMAEMVAKEVADNKVSVVIDIPEDSSKLGYALPTKMHLSSKKMQALGWKPGVGLKEAYERMIEWMNCCDIDK